jgi:branched-chain amino acid transport system ATP-binding protein
VPSGAVVALLGPNGAGKTTLLRVASGQSRPAQGRMLIDGQDVTGLGAADLARLGVCHVPEGRGIFRRLTVRENLRLQAPPVLPSETATELAVDAFPILGKRLNQTAGTLSGGQQQMLETAMALMLRPRLILIDEPTLGLAPILVHEVFEVIQEIKSKGTTVLLVEQNAKRALEISDYAFVLELGSIRFQGSASELARNEDVISAYLGER